MLSGFYDLLTRCGWGKRKILSKGHCRTEAKKTMEARMSSLTCPKKNKVPKTTEDIKICQKGLDAGHSFKFACSRHASNPEALGLEGAVAGTAERLRPRHLGARPARAEAASRAVSGAKARAKAKSSSSLLGSASRGATNTGMQPGIPTVLLGSASNNALVGSWTDAAAGSHNNSKGP